MKIFRKERLPNGRRHIYFMGRKIFSYRRNQTAPAVDYARIMAGNVFTRDGFNQFEYDFLKCFFQNKSVLANYDDKYTWLICMTMLIQNQDFASAENIFWAYYKRFGCVEIEKYAPICELASSFGIRNELTDKTIAVAFKVKKIRAEKRFENMILGAKSIAIVGRSPILVGRGLGAEIDSHDIVIRFNMADVSGKYADDFGVKNDVMVINCWNKSDDRAFYIYKDFRTFGAFPDVTAAIDADDCKNSDFLDFGLKAWCCNESGLNDPTSGAIMIMWIKKILGNLDNVDIYGFAFQDENMNLGHYDCDHVINDNIHNMRAEIEYLRKLVKGDKNGKKI